MNIKVYPLTVEQKEAVIAINNQTKKYAVICDYGNGPAISAEISGRVEFEQHMVYITSQNIEEQEVFVDEDK